MTPERLQEAIHRLKIEFDLWKQAEAVAQVARDKYEQAHKAEIEAIFNEAKNHDKR